MLDADWDREAATFDLAPDHGLLEGEVRRAWRRLLQAHLPPAPAQVLDIGCGTGSLSILLAEEGHTVSSADFSSEMLTRATSKAMGAGVSVALARADATCLPIRRGAVDVVLCRHVLWALDDIDGVLEHWSELLRPTGRLLLIGAVVNWRRPTSRRGGRCSQSARQASAGRRARRRAALGASHRR